MLLRSLPVVQLERQRRGYSGRQVDRVFQTLGGLADQIELLLNSYSLTSTTDDDISDVFVDEQRLQLLRRLPDIRFEQRLRGYSKQGVDEILASLNPLADDIEQLQSAIQARHQ